MIEEVELLMDSLPKHYLDNQPWPEFKTNCQTSFSVAHSGRAILLKYFVQEDLIKVAMHNTNEQVHRDNCVEFFIGFEQGKEYYNIEINCMGICSMAYGDGRSNRTTLQEELIKKIQTTILIKSAPVVASTNFQWEITMIIPMEVFAYDNLKSFRDQTAVANFFKCGDDLPAPHYLTWNTIDAKTPDFHLPEFFGELEFG